MKKMHDNTLKIIVLITALCGLSAWGVAQNGERTYTGHLTDEADEQVVAGATLRIKNTNRGSITDAKGDFSLIAFPKEVLVVSFVGYEDREIRLGDATTLDIQIKRAANVVDEVVIVGYGTERKVDLTGSVGSISKKDLDKVPVTSMDQLLQGRLAGVQVIQGSAAPGGGLNIRIRGGNSLNASNDPLFVIDGFPLENQDAANNSGSIRGGWGGGQQPNNALAGFSPKDIESIEVLKDASAVAIYGARAANGVVIITTKKGSGVKKVEVSSSVDVSQLRRRIDVLDGSTYANYVNEAYRNAGQPELYNGKPDAQGRISFPLPENVSSVNWQDQVFRTGLTQNHKFSFSGSQSGGNYYVTVDLANQDGIVKNTNMQRGSLRINVNQNIRKFLDVGVGITVSRTKIKAAQSNNNTSGNDAGGAIRGAVVYQPTYLALDEFGNFNTSQLNNPLVFVYDVKDDMLMNRALGNTYAKINFNKYLSFKTSLGLYYNGASRDIYWPRNTWVGRSYQGIGMLSNSENSSYTFENNLSYVRNIGDRHRLNSVLGFSYQAWNYARRQAVSSKFPNDQLGYTNLSQGETVTRPESGFSKGALESFYARLNYTLHDRYIFTLSGRYDGSTRFAENNKFSVFPSGALGWRLSEEPFIKDLKVFSNLKLRASYGLSGNEAISPYQSLPRLGVLSYPFGSALNTGIGPVAIPNPDLKWETTRMSDIGIEMGFFNNRLRLEGDVYLKRTVDLLQPFALPASLGFTSVVMNRGSIENKGLELTLQAGVAVQKKLKWDINANFSMNRNKILELGVPPDPVTGEVQLFGYVLSYDALGAPAHVSREGQPIGMFWGFKTDGIYQNAQEVERGPEKDRKPGEIRIADLDGDGQITDLDKTIIGNPNADFTAGLTNNFSYKNFTLSIFLQAVVGNDIINANLANWENLNGGINITRRAWEGRWQGEGSSNYYPMPFRNNITNRITDRFIEDGSFLRLKNIHFAYKIPENKYKWLKGADIFISATNLLTFTTYSGFDPDVSSYHRDNFRPGTDNESYPTAKMFSTGINIKF